MGRGGGEHSLHWTGWTGLHSLETQILRQQWRYRGEMERGERRRVLSGILGAISKIAGDWWTVSLNNSLAPKWFDGRCGKRRKGGCYFCAEQKAFASSLSNKIVTYICDIYLMYVWCRDLVQQLSLDVKGREEREEEKKRKREGMSQAGDKQFSSLMGLTGFSPLVLHYLLFPLT